MGPLLCVCVVRWDHHSVCVLSDGTTVLCVYVLSDGTTALCVFVLSNGTTALCLQVHVGACQ